MNTLIDSFGRAHTYLRISITDRCNLQCIYCMPSCGIKWKEHKEILTYEEIRRIATLFVNMGIKKIRLTGGEPIVRKNIEELVEKLALINGLETLAMTTNAVLLKDKVFTLKKSGLNALNISLDTLRKERFKQITKLDSLTNVLESINAAIQAGFNLLKLNVVVMKGINEDEILDFVYFLKDKPINIRFIEFMPFKGNEWEHSRFVPYLEMKKIIEEHYELIPIHNKTTNIAKDFCIEGFQGTISFITSMTESFCSTCNRIRLTADGSIKTCLFHSPEVSLRDAIRNGATDSEVTQMIQTALILKKIGHESADELIKIENQCMIQIGG
ncbi:MAG: GTP 3',8-cyclase MoaA [Candidatus Melainabacteria bacterium]|nr:GTP 3',8-cyclase MoaA [Candidatus Melainabacteria bacterium]